MIKLYSNDFLKQKKLLSRVPSCENFQLTLNYDIFIQNGSYFESRAPLDMLKPHDIEYSTCGA